MGFFSYVGMLLIALLLGFIFLLPEGSETPYCYLVLIWSAAAIACFPLDRFIQRSKPALTTRAKVLKNMTC